MESSLFTILVVDDEKLTIDLIAKFLSDLGHTCVTTRNGLDALEKMKENKFDAVITDIKMPKMDGIELTKEISKQYPGLPVMVITGFVEEYSEGEVISAGAQDFIKKPFVLSEFLTRLDKMINDSKVKGQQESGKNGSEKIDGLLGELETILKKSDDV